MILVGIGWLSVPPIFGQSLQLVVWEFPYGGRYYLGIQEGRFASSYRYTKYLGHTYQGIMQGKVNGNVMEGEWFEVDDNGAPADAGTMRMTIDGSTYALTIVMNHDGDYLQTWELDFLKAGDADTANTYLSLFDEVKTIFNQGLESAQ
jgi:hypothetical protein